eukprot:10493686-Alexandrium_andersonii.AAC.1
MGLQSELKLELLHRRKAYRLYQAPSAWATLMHAPRYDALGERAYGAVFAVKGMRPLERASYLDGTASPFANVCLVGDVSGRDASWRECHQRWVELERSRLFRGPG